MICGKCPFFDACRCRDKETGATNGQCSLSNDFNDKAETHPHHVNALSNCLIPLEQRELALYDLVRHQGWIIDTLMTEIIGICMGVDCVAEVSKDPKFEKLNKFTTSIREVMDKKRYEWRKE